MNHFGGGDACFNLLFYRSELLKTLLARTVQRSFRELATKHLTHHFSGSIRGQQLRVHQVHHQRSHATAILHSTTHIGWEAASANRLALWAVLDFCSVLYHL